MISRAEQLSVTAAARRAPSAHNTQPARWHFGDDGSVELHEDLSRRLYVGDPEGRDALVGLGAALEGLHIALGQHGRGVIHVERDVHPIVDETARGTRRVAVATLGDGHRDPLYAFIDERRSYRGVFVEAASRLTAFVAGQRDATDLAFLTSRADIDRIAEVHDACTHEFMRDPRYQAELWQWMRLTPRDPRWARDGLSADCLALNAVERTAARLLMRPRVFSLVDRVGAAGALISEAKQVRSASGIVILHRPHDEDPLATGRRFYRIWLELAQAGLSACPMSALTDSATGRDALRRLTHIADDRRLINAFRVGRAARSAPRSARLPIDELLI